MVSHLFFYLHTLIALVWLCLMLQWVWPSDLAAGCPTTPEPPGPRPKRRREPTPFAGLTTKPHCDAWAPTPGGHREAFLPQPGLCLSGLGGLGEPPRQWPSQWRALAATAVRRLSRLLSGDPRHALPWQAGVGRAHRARHRLPGGGPGHPGHGAGVRGRGEYGAPVVGRGRRAAAAFSQHFLYDVRVRQVQLDEVFALLSAVKEGTVSEADAIARLERAPQWVWAAMDT